VRMLAAFVVLVVAIFRPVYVCKDHMYLDIANACLCDEIVLAVEVAGLRDVSRTRPDSTSSEPKSLSSSSFLPPRPPHQHLYTPSPST
jgi:hypothetical protein